MFRLLILFAISLALLGCKSDPYEDLGEQRDGGYGQLEDERLVTADNQQGPKAAIPFHLSKLDRSRMVNRLY